MVDLQGRSAGGAVRRCDEVAVICGNADARLPAVGPTADVIEAGLDDQLQLEWIFDADESAKLPVKLLFSSSRKVRR